MFVMTSNSKDQGNAYSVQGGRYRASAAAMPQDL